MDFLVHLQKWLLSVGTEWLEYEYPLWAMLGGTQRQGQWVSRAHVEKKMFHLKFKGNYFPASSESHWTSERALGPEGLWCWWAQNSELSISIGHNSTLLNLKSQLFFFETCNVQDRYLCLKNNAWKMTNCRVFTDVCVCMCLFMYCVYVYVYICAHASICAYGGQWSASVIFLYSLLLMWVRVPHKHGDYSRSLTSKSLTSAFLCPFTAVTSS